MAANQWLRLMFAFGIAVVDMMPVAGQVGGLADLTVPADKLTAGCELSPTPSVRLDGNRVRGGLWGSLQINRNPWIGVDRVMTATIRERLDPPYRLPDGPPLNPAQLAEFRLHLADGISASYAGFYYESGTGEVIAVYGLAFPDAADANSFVQSRQRLAGVLVGIYPTTVGQVIAIVSGREGPCFRAIESYLHAIK